MALQERGNDKTHPLMQCSNTRNLLGESHTARRVRLIDISSHMFVHPLYVFLYSLRGTSRGSGVFLRYDWLKQLATSEGDVFFFLVRNTSKIWAVTLCYYSETDGNFRSFGAIHVYIKLCI